MQPEQIRLLLEEVQTGARSIDQAFTQLAELPFSDIGDAKIDNHRALRCGFAEVVLCRGKDPREVARILEEGLRSTPCMLATRAEKRHIDAVRERFPNAIVNARGGTIRVGTAVSMKARGTVMVVTAGTSDIPIAEEALETLRAFGCEGWHCYDVGVAGLHRVLSELPTLRKAAAIICIAGMEGALPSVIGGLVACPVIAVPSSVGYGASFNGVAALLGMLNTCAAGVTVVNIDNGFGAAMCALRMIADREYPIVETQPPIVPEVNIVEVAAVNEPARDEQLARLEAAVERLARIAQQPAAAPAVEASSPGRDEQIARLERAIAELTASAAKHAESAEKIAAAKTDHQDALVSRLEQAAQNLGSVASKPVVVESPRIEIHTPSHPSHEEQTARLERGIAELAALVAKQELSEGRNGETRHGHQELLARLEQAIANIATILARPVAPPAAEAPGSVSVSVEPPHRAAPKTTVVKDKARGTKAAVPPRKIKK